MGFELGKLQYPLFLKDIFPCQLQFSTDVV